MYYSIHSEFIETPLIEVLMEGIQACRPLGVGIHTEPMKEYFLSSLFLRMTGAQEQKLKCICWELGTHDYDFRYQHMLDRYSYGEMSDRSSRNNFYKELRKKIEDITGTPEPQPYLDQNVTEGIRDDVVRLFHDYPMLEAWLKPELDFVRDTAFFPQAPDSYKEDKNKQALCGGLLGADYDAVVYRHRNRCAHNLKSYQRSFDSLDTLKAKDYPRHNYVYRFIILIVIDRTFTELYKKYKQLVEERPWY